MKARFLLALAVVGVAILATPLAANPRVDFVSNWAKTDNMTALGFSPRLVEFPGPAAGRINSDLAFWGDMVVQGTYEGFRLIDVTYPSRPKEIINYEECAPDSTAGNQGDVLIYGDILVRSWNSNAPSATPVTCDGQTVPGGFEGLHIFSIANKQNPQLLTSIDLACGSHTASMLPDLANGRLIVFNGSSSGTCENIDIIGIPLANPAAAAVIRQEPTADHPVTTSGSSTTPRRRSSAAPAGRASRSSRSTRWTEPRSRIPSPCTTSRCPASRSATRPSSRRTARSSSSGTSPAAARSRAAPPRAPSCRAASCRPTT